MGAEAKKAAKAKKAAAAKAKKAAKKAKPSKKAKTLKKKAKKPTKAKRVKKAKKLIEFIPDVFSSPVVGLFGALSCGGVLLAVFRFRRSVSSPTQEPLLV